MTTDTEQWRRMADDMTQWSWPLRVGLRHAADEVDRLRAERADLEARVEMLATVVRGAKEEFVRVPYGASHEDVAAINDWHKMATEALGDTQ